MAENAGGNKAVKYGTTSVIYTARSSVAHWEMRLWAECLKDVTGYDLVHLMVGSEGTLGIVTKVYLKLMPLPRYVVDLLVPFDDMKKAINIVPIIMTHGGIIPTSVEFMDNLSIKAAEKYLNQKLPHSDAAAYVLITVDGSSEQQVEEEFETIGLLCEENGGLEVFVADNKAVRDRIWKARKCYAEALRAISPVYCMEDIVVPTSHIPQALEEIYRLADKYEVKIPCAGHAGDGNIHATLLREDMDEQTWQEKKKHVLEEMYKVVYDLTVTCPGSTVSEPSARMSWHAYDPVQLNMIRSIKKALDPNLIMNPGKIVDVE